MQRKIIATTLIVLAIALFIIGFFMLNQYFSASAALAPSLERLNDPSAAASLGVSQEEIDSTRALLASTSNSLLYATVIDFFLGALFFAGGLWLYPKGEK